MVVSIETGVVGASGRYASYWNAFLLNKFDTILPPSWRLLFAPFVIGISDRSGFTGMVYVKTV